MSTAKITTYTLEDINHLIKLSKLLSYAWFRGQTKKREFLQPTIFRQSQGRTDFELFLDNAAVKEKDILLSFQRYGYTEVGHTPRTDEHEVWLIWGQHHGLPTRLLDWTENILVAAFFASNNNLKEDGEIWAISPEELNRLSNIEGIAAEHHDLVRYHSSSAFMEVNKQFESTVNDIYKPEFPVAFRPRNRFNRMAAQHSTFTIHPDNGPDLIEILAEKKLRLRDAAAIIRIVIPSGIKSTLFQDLHPLGINYRTLFPDLDGLSKHLLIWRDDKKFIPDNPEEGKTFSEYKHIEGRDGRR
ncbi:MAG: FRG domain-containing protein [Bacteroidota bacterium]